MAIRRQLCAFGLLLLACAAGAAEEWTPTRAFRTFNKSTWRGLPQSSVMALAQDSEGVMWIGTLDGAATFDGRTITPVADVPGAPLRGVIAAIVARARGGVYVASQAGVHVYERGAWRLINVPRAVAAMTESRDGVLWIADTSGAVWTLRGANRWDAHPEITQPVAALAAAPDGAIWAATDNNALRIAHGRVEAVGGAPLPARPGAILVAHDGRVYVATLGCSMHWTRGGADGWHQAPFASWTRGGFRAIAEDRRGRVWAGSYSGSVVFGNADSPWTIWRAENGPFEGGVMSLLADREGSVWFGFNAIGLVQWIGEGWSHRTAVEPGVPRPEAYAAFGVSRTFDGNGILASIFHSGVLRLDASGVHRYSAEQGLTEDVRAAVEPEPNTIFAGTRFGIFESHNGGPFRQTLKLPAGFVMGFFRSPQGRWYAGSSTHGIYVRDGEQWRLVPELNAFLDDLHVRDMKWRRNGELWVATLRGITVFRDGADPRRISARTIRAVPESVNAILDLSDDEVWAGGTGGIAIRRGTQWTRMTESDGIPGTTIYSLARGRDGAIWAGGSAGVGRYANGRWTVWDTRDGLLQDECNLNGLVVADDGTVYVGAMSGLAKFDPRVTAPAPPPLRIFWRSVPPHELPRGERALHLRWSAPWLGPHPVEYRVRVPRLHDAWSAPTPEDHLDVENLGEGDWRVEVEARVEGTQQWSAPLTLNVIVPPFWYETTAARVAAIALLALLVYAIVKLRVAALHRRAAALEAIVHERTAELAEKVEQLKESEQRALAASRAKSAFLANMSHELRTPLNGVLGFAQLLARRPHRDAEDRHGLDVIIRSGEHLLGLINDVLSLSKIEAGKITLDPKPFDLRNLLRDVEHVLRFRAEEKGLRFTCTLDAPALREHVAGDEMRLRQILINLAGNAVKFTQSGHVSVCGAWRNGRATFEVDDSGPGIGAHELPRLFEPFVQSESGQRTKEGTGLGLALSRNLARLMGGDITVRSVEGRGSTFRFDVPLPEVTIVAATAEDERRVVSLAPGQDPVRILVVDDNALNREVLRKLLESAGFDVREAANGVEALELWRTWEPRLIWMDKLMTVMDGLEATRRIRDEERATGRTPVRILALSASALDHERGEILAAGCDDFVAKPFREATIFARIREHLGVDYIYGDEHAVAAPAPVSHATTPAPSDRRVLIVDDDWVCREVATEILRGTGVGVTPASSGAEALQLLEAKTFDLVLMDLRMPDMGGIETARRIRATANAARLPIIAMSADAFDGDAARLKETGMDDYVGKPVEPRALARVLERWLH